MSERVLVVFPHPDDEAFSSSGTIAKLIAEGAHVTYACLTLGEMGRNLGVPLIANRVTLPSIRKQELHGAAKAIGIQDVRSLGYLDKTVEFEPYEKIDADIAALIAEIKPHRIITFLPGYSVHPDHNATGAAVVRVVSRLPKDEQPIVWCVAFAHHTVEDCGEPDVVINIEPYLSNKYNALAAHASQVNVKKMFGDFKKDYASIVKNFATERFWTYKFD